MPSSWNDYYKQQGEEQLREEFQPIRKKYNLNIALMLQTYLDNWVDAHTVEDFDISEIK